MSTVSLSRRGPPSSSPATGASTVFPLMVFETPVYLERRCCVARPSGDPVAVSDELPWPAAVRVSYDQTGDAVVVVPGIMGSALYDTVAEKTVWGLRPGWYARAWSRSGPGMAPLAVSEDELAGRSTRVKPVALLTFPAFSPVLGGFEPYTPLVRAIRKVVRHSSAVLEFAYDWRLAVDRNGRLLADAMAAHLARWRERSKRPDAQVVLIAHSMGGLVCQALAAIPGAVADVRAVITLGTPFDGAAKAAVLLGSGEGALLPRRRLRAIAATMPGVYDLLPRYRCVDEGDTVRRVAPADVAALGGHASLASAAFDRHAARASVVIPQHRAVIGVAQPTWCSLTVLDGVVTAHPYTFEVDADGELAREHTGLLVRRSGIGDGTVPRSSARPRMACRLLPSRSSMVCWLIRPRRSPLSGTCCCTVPPTPENVSARTPTKVSGWRYPTSSRRGGSGSPPSPASRSNWRDAPLPILTVVRWSTTRVRTVAMAWCASRSACPRPGCTECGWMVAESPSLSS